MGKFNVNDREAAFMHNIANVWWDKDGPTRGMHDYNDIRVQFITESLIANEKLQPDRLNAPDALKGFKILEVGCGGGILTEAIGKVQADVVGLDPVDSLIEVARQHLKITQKEHKMSVQYVCDVIENHCEENLNKYDVIVCSEVVEHVEDKESLLRSCIKALKPDGEIILTTQSRTFFCWFAFILVAEYILNLIPRGGHKFSWFITPDELAEILAKYGCRTNIVRGTWYNFITRKFRYISYKGFCYALHATKEKKFE